MLIKPYNQIQKGGNSDTIAAEFPACKLFLPFDTPADGDNPREVVSGGSVDMTGPSNSIDWLTNPNAATLDTFSLTNTLLPNAIAVGVNRALFIVIGSGAVVSNIEMRESGNSSRLTLDLVSGTHRAATDEGSSTPSIGAPGGSVKAHAIQFIPGTTGEGVAYQVAEAAAETPVAENGTSDLTTMESITQISSTVVVTPMLAYSWQIWVWSSYFPSNAEINTAMAWMLNQHLAGNKYLYPGWLGRS